MNNESSQPVQPILAGVVEADRDARIAKVFDEFDMGMYQNQHVTNYRTEASAFAFDALRKILEGR
jgi:hypothetical protein